MLQKNWKSYYEKKAVVKRLFFLLKFCCIKVKLRVKYNKKYKGGYNVTIKKYY